MWNESVECCWKELREQCTCAGRSTGFSWIGKPTAISSHSSSRDRGRSVKQPPSGISHPPITAVSSRSILWRILNTVRLRRMDIPVQLAKENKKFQISKVAKGARFKDYRGCVEWLETAGIVNVCHCLSFPELPLRGNYDENKFKMYFADTGLFVSMLDDEASDDFRANRNLGVYKGALYESVVGEALRKAGYDLYYYKRENSTLEEDFFVRSSDALIPVEVKSKNGTAKSLRTLIASDSYPDIRFGIKLTAGNIGSSNGIFTAPYFTTFLLRRLLKTFDEDGIDLFGTACA